MQFGGVLPEDAPDPRLGEAERLRLMPVPVIGLAPQSPLEEVGVGVGSSGGTSGLFQVDASISYLLWRNPADRSDPVNLAGLDDQVRRSLEEVPPWPRPKWLVERVEQMRYPQLWEAVKTTWHRDPSEHTTLPVILTQHANYILNNIFRTQRGLERNPWEAPPANDITENAVRRGVPVLVDGVKLTGAEIDTDPFIYGVGAELHTGGLLTAVLPRDELDYIHIEFSQRDKRSPL